MEETATKKKHGFKKSMIGFILKYYWVVFLFIGTLFFARKISTILLVIFLIILGGLSYIYRIFIPISLGIELITPFTLLIAYMINPFVGWISAIMMILISAIISRRVCYYTAVKVAQYGIICLFFAVMLPSFGFLATGKILVVILNILFITANIIFHDFKTIADIPGNVINVIWVWVVLGWISGFL
jgi:hypothetical protein